MTYPSHLRIKQINTKPFSCSFLFIYLKKKKREKTKASEKASIQQKQLGVDLQFFSLCSRPGA